MSDNKDIKNEAISQPTEAAKIQKPEEEKKSNVSTEFTSKFSSYITEERLNEKLISIENSFNESIKQTKQSFENDIRDAEIKVNKDRSSLISIFGIFASITTFLLIQIQILKNVMDFWRLLGLSAFLLGSMLTFILLLQYVAKSWVETNLSISWKELFSIGSWKINLSIVTVVVAILISYSISLIAFINADRFSVEQSVKITEVSKRVQNIEQAMKIRYQDKKK